MEQNNISIETLREEIERTLRETKAKTLCDLGEKYSKYKKGEYVKLLYRIDERCPFFRGQTLLINGRPTMSEHDSEVYLFLTDGERHWNVFERDVLPSNELEYKKGMNWYQKIFG
jgi:hypothetical protein